jgi:hypothetical protein
MTKNYAIIWWAAALLLAGCNQQTIYRTASGLQFMIYLGPNGQTTAAGSGATVKLSYTLRHGDSVVSTTEGRMPMYQPLIPGLIFPYSPMEALTSGVHPGDSIVAWQRVDSMRRKGMLAQLPKDWRMSDRLTATMKVLAVFPFDYHHGDSAVRADKLAEATALLEREQPLAAAHMAQWLREQSITATPTPDGVFLQVLTAGTGPAADSGSHLKLYIPPGTGVPPSAVVRQGQIPGDDMQWEVWW